MEKIAVIDLGSNSARLVLVEKYFPTGQFVVFDELEEKPFVSGQDMDRDGKVKAVESGTGYQNA